MKRTLGFFSPRARSRNSASRRRRSRGSSVVWVRSPVNPTKSGCVSRALTAAIAFGRVPAASGLTAGPWNPQWVSESWTKKNSSWLEPYVPAPRASPEVNTTPPRPASLTKFLRFMRCKTAGSAFLFPGKGRVWLTALDSVLAAGVGCCAVPFKGAQMKKILGGLLVAFAFALPQAYAGLVPTERERVKALIERPEVAQQMEKMGIPAKEALARVDAMTEEEVRSLAGRLDALPAGGQISSQTLLLICLIIILLLLI